jgi:sporulation-control protein spo0M
MCLLLADVAMEAQRIDSSLALLETLLASAPIGVAFFDRALRWPGSMGTTSPA